MSSAGVYAEPLPAPPMPTSPTSTSPNTVPYPPSPNVTLPKLPQMPTSRSPPLPDSPTGRCGTPSTSLAQPPRPPPPSPHPSSMHWLQLRCPMGGACLIFPLLYQTGTQLVACILSASRGACRLCRAGLLWILPLLCCVGQFDIAYVGSGY